MDPDPKAPGSARSETALFWAITLTYLWYALGALYLVAPLVGWALIAVWMLAVLQALRGAGRIGALLPLWSLPWVLGMAVMLLALLIGHVEGDLGAGQTLKSAIGWAKGWALMAIFVLVGALGIRPERIYRAACWVGAQSLVLLPLFIGAWLLGLPERLYVSPLQAVGGPGPEFFAVQLYETDPGTGLPRWRLFAPWAPAAGMVGCLFFLFAVHERNPYWRAAGTVGCVAICLVSLSRMALVSLVAVSAVLIVLRGIRKPWLWYLAGLGVFGLALFSGPLTEAGEDLRQAFLNARAGSSRVRALLADIAVTRWLEDAFWWGHGVVERGPHLVEYMPIGSHHTWYGLLFVKGLVGAVSLALPMLISLLALGSSAHRRRDDAVALAVMLILCLYSFGENLEILAYLFWPGLVVVGSVWRSSLTDVHAASVANCKETHASGPGDIRQRPFWAG